MKRQHIPFKIAAQKSFAVSITKRARQAIGTVIVFHIIMELGKTSMYQLEALTRKLDLPVKDVYLSYTILSLEKWGYIKIAEPEPGWKKPKWITLTEKGMLAHRNNLEGFEGMLAVGELLKMRRDELLKL